MAETWLPVVGYEGLYEVSDQGNVLSVKRRILLRPQPKDAYLTVKLSKDGVARTCYIHTLVLEAHVCPRPEGMQGCHGPGGSRDNRVENLRWDTPPENVQDKRRHRYPAPQPATHCPAGHEYTDENTYHYVRKDGRREKHCRQCRADRAYERYELKRGRHPERHGRKPRTS